MHKVFFQPCFPDAFFGTNCHSLWGHCTVFVLSPGHTWWSFICADEGNERRSGKRWRWRWRRWWRCLLHDARAMRHGENTNPCWNRTTNPFLRGCVVFVEVSNRVISVKNSIYEVTMFVRGMTTYYALPDAQSCSHTWTDDDEERRGKKNTNQEEASSRMEFIDPLSGSATTVEVRACERNTGTGCGVVGSCGIPF